MKRFIFSVFCLSSLTVSANALVETCLTFGPSFQNLVNVSGDPIQSPWGDNGTLGLNLNCSEFWNGGKIGFFVMANVLFISLYNTGIKKGSPDIEVFGYQTALGPGFRHVIAPKLTILGGLGPNCYIQMLSADYGTTWPHRLSTFNFGAAGQAGIKLDLTNALCLLFGVNAAYNFLNNNFSEWELKSNITVSPFIGFGFNLYRNSDYLGKPDNAGKSENPN